MDGIINDWFFNRLCLRWGWGVLCCKWVDEMGGVK